MKILVVEDDVVARRILRLILERQGHEVIEAENGAIAWEHLQREPVRVVVSDWMMPQLDGLELCRRIRARADAGYTYFILVTARGATEANRREAAEADVDDFLSKPPEPDDLWRRLRVAERIIRSASQVRQLEALLPVCTYCKKIRDDRNYWQQIESYFHAHTRSKVSHSICPDCYQNIIVPQLLAAGITPGKLPPLSP
jgi:DNA-binding response OmpR family regulator